MSALERPLSGLPPAASRPAAPRSAPSRSAAAGSEPLLQAFPPLVDSGARALVLGSMPGVASLRANAYYAHPRNAFWPLMEQLLGISAEAPYALRCAALCAQGVALWDVLAACRRRGSLDANIESRSVQANAFAAFFARHASIRSVFFNGAMAETLYRRHVLATLGGKRVSLRYARLPSTSPAATMPRADKRAAWLAVRDAVSRPGP